MNKKTFSGSIESLRSTERIMHLEVHQVVELCLDDNSIGNMLDVGTGSGIFAEAFFEHGIKVSGVDANKKMLTVARSFVPDGDFREGAAELLPYPDRTFDLVFLGVVLHETDNPLKALKESKRVSRGQVCILEWPYRRQSFGPRLAHRINPTFLEELFRLTGFEDWQTTELNDTILYRLNVSPKPKVIS